MEHLKSMKRQKKSKLDIVTWATLPVTMLFCFVLGYMSVMDVKLENITWCIRECFTHFWAYRITSGNLKGALIGAVIWGIAFLRIKGDSRKLIPGLEYGSARLGDPEKVTRALTKAKGPDETKILSENLQMSLDTHFTKLNNNTVTIGGSGAGKTFFFVLINALRGYTSMVFTDPKSELFQKLGNVLKAMGYRIVTFNLIDMKKSDHYNPLAYIRSDNDIVKLVTNILTNTMPKGSTPSDPFWENALALYLQAIISYVWYECPKHGKNANIREVMNMLNKAKVAEKEGDTSELDDLMYGLMPDHPARVAYEKVRSGAKDTIRSIIISAHARLAFLQNPDILRILDDDDIDIRSIGEGVYQNPDRKTALFCIIPDSDKSYNFLVGVLDAQIFQELYYVADFEHNGSLPVPVAFWMDEFANVPLPDGFTEILSTMRSRNISANIILQNKAQLQALFKDSYQTILGNCDVMVYLGGNESETHKLVSEMLGKFTAEKKSTGETLGQHGSSSRNYDVLGREILTPDEVRKLDNRKCLVFIRGFDPVLDDKCHTWERDEYIASQKMGLFEGNQAVDDLYEEGRRNFYMDAEGEKGDADSYHYQVETYQAVFAGTKACSKTVKLGDHLFMPDPKLGGYQIRYERSQEEVFPVFDREKAVNVSTGGAVASKYPIVGYADKDGRDVRLTTEGLEKIFRKGNTITPAMRLLL